MYAENPFQPGARLHSVFDRLASRRPPPPIMAHEPFDSEITITLNELAEEDTEEKPGANLLAAFHLWNDDPVRALSLIQPRQDDSTSSYIHSIICRREGDWSSARYWIAQTGRHPFYDPLLELARTKLRGSLADALRRWSRWEGGRMIDLCEKGNDNPGPVADQVAELAALEMCGLIVWCAKNRE